MTGGLVTVNTNKYDAQPTQGSKKLLTSGAVYEAIQGLGLAVDAALSDSSTNPVQNKVVKAALDGISVGARIENGYLVI